MPVRSQLTVALWSASALFLAGMVGTQAHAQTPQYGGTAIFTVTGDPITFNPSVQTNVADEQIGCIIYPSLIQFTDQYVVHPYLAKSWTISPDGLTYTFLLNKAEWHDGKPFTSDDVKYTIEEVSTKLSSVFRRAGEAISKVEAPAPDKVVITLKQGFGPFLVSLGCEQGAAMLPAHLFRGTDPLKNPATLTDPIGTGAFKFQEWKRGQYVRLVKNPKYFESGKPYLDEVIAKVIPQASARTAALQAGEVDMSRGMATNDYASVRANPKLALMDDAIAPSMAPLFFNIKHKPLDDKRVRQALFMAMDRDYIIKNAYFGDGKPGVQPLSARVAWTREPSIDYGKMYPYNVAKANALLDEAGVKRGADGKRFKVSLLPIQGYPEFEQVSVALKSMWGEVGIEVIIENLDIPTYLQRVYTDGNFDVAINGYGTYGDPALGQTRMWAAALIGKPYGNASGYSNPKVEELFTQAERATAHEERAKFYSEAQKIVAEDLPVIDLRDYQAQTGINRKLHGVLGTYLSSMGTWYSAWMEK